MAKRHIAERQVEAAPTSFWVAITVLVVLGLAVFAIFKIVTIVLL